MEANDYLNINKQTWNNKVEVHVNSDFYDMEGFLKGKSTLNSIELDLLGDVSGKRVLHLQCHFGQDTMTLARMGAKATGIDLSDKAIEKAREINEKLGLDAKQVYKTLLVELTPKEFVVCIIPVANQLNLKEVADIFGVKKAQMANKDEAQKITGYLLGGISPLGQKKLLKTVLDESIRDFKTVFVSGGKRGLDIEVFPKDLEVILKAKVGRIVS